MRDNGASLYATAFLLTGAAADSEDLLQDVLTSLYPKWRHVAAADSPVAYVRRCLVNRFVSQRRLRSARVASVALPPDLPESVAAADPVAALLDRFTLQHMLAGLPLRQRAAVVLRYYDDLDEAGIAAALGCRQATVRSLISRGLRTLRDRAARTTRMDHEQEEVS